MKKLICILLAVMISVVCFVGCEEVPGARADIKKTKEAANNLQANQPTPTDLNYSLERYNLIRRAYWVNGQREKANALPCQIEKPLGYIILMTESGSVVGKFTVDGKVSSLNSFLTPDSEYYEKTGSSDSVNNLWLADVDGSYGENDNGIFFFDVRGNYYEWTGTYLYTDVPMEIQDPVVTFDYSND